MDSGSAKVQPPQAADDNAPANAQPVRASDVDDAPRALAGKTIGRYRLLYPIAAGGMAQVWTARAEGGGLSRTVAIKLVRPEYAADEEYSRMFIDEAMVASSIHHPNVCEIHELGRDGDLLFMVLEWVAGDSLSGLVQRGSELRPLPDVIAARIAADACAGLHAAHEALGPDGQLLGIVHRDVSPPNILISVHGHVKVSDFGIAKARHQLHSRTRTGEIKGKFAYIPPEQILGRGVDRRADVYAMGCVLYVAALGLRPFGGGATALGKIVQGKFRLPRELRPDFPEELEQIIIRALAPDPNNRYKSADEMRIALEQWMLGSAAHAAPSDLARIVKERMNPERRKLVEAVMSSSRSLPESLAYHLLSAQDNKTETPTATSGLVVQPSLLKKSLQEVASTLTPSRPSKVTPPPKPEPSAPTHDAAREEEEDEGATLIAKLPESSFPKKRRSDSGAPTVRPPGAGKSNPNASEAPAITATQEEASLSVASHAAIANEAAADADDESADEDEAAAPVAAAPSNAESDVDAVDKWTLWLFGIAAAVAAVAYALHG